VSWHGCGRAGWLGTGRPQGIAARQLRDGCILSDIFIDQVRLDAAGIGSLSIEIRGQGCTVLKVSSDLARTLVNRFLEYRNVPAIEEVRMKR
jgi:hypothetical protein